MVSNMLIDDFFNKKLAVKFKHGEEELLTSFQDYIGNLFFNSGARADDDCIKRYIRNTGDEMYVYVEKKYMEDYNVMFIASEEEFVREDKHKYIVPAEIFIPKEKVFNLTDDEIKQLFE